MLSKSTAQLSQVLSQSQGQRVTRAEPFRLSTDFRPKVQVLSQDEVDQREMNKQFK